MLHFSCDLCGIPLPGERHVLKIELFPTHEPRELTEQDLDIDPLEVMEDLLSDLELHASNQSPDELDANDGPQFFRFDLCAACRAKFLRDPLGRDAVRRVNFSKN